MSDGPDPNDIRRHAKRMHTEAEYRRRYRQIDFYKPNSKQLAFHNLIDREIMLRAGNQLGKTHAVGAQMVMDALNLYPDWYRGRQIGAAPKITRSVDFMGWASCTTSTMTREGVQTKLLGDIMSDGGLGTGLIPLDDIVGKPAMARGISNFVDTVSLKRESGGSAAIQFKTYEMGRDAFQAVPVDRIWLDEDSGEGDIYGECLARTTTTNGRIYVSMTPMKGLSPIRKRFKSHLPGTAEVLMTIDDAAVSKGGHIADERIAEILAGMKDSERQTRGFGADMQGEGSVFDTPVERIREKVDPEDFPPYWPWLWSVDFRHSGSATTGHPFAAVLAAWDRDTDCIHVVHCLRMLGLAPMHVAAMKQHKMWRAPVAWPHDGGRGASLISGETVAKTYKALGLNMMSSHATFHSGGYNFEAGIDLMAQRIATGRLKVAAHLAEFFDEYQGYHRKDGLVVKVDDDLLSATRIGVMAIRDAKVPEVFGSYGRRQLPTSQDWDVFTGAPV